MSVTSEAIHKDNPLVETAESQGDSAKFLKDSSDFIESTKDSNDIDCHSPNGLRNDEQRADCHALTSSSFAMTILWRILRKTPTSRNDGIRECLIDCHA